MHILDITVCFLKTYMTFGITLLVIRKQITFYQLAWTALKRQEPSETDYAPRIDLFLESEGHWEMCSHRRGGWGVTDYLC